MGKIDYGNDMEYASSRLRSSVVLLDGTPVYIKEVYGEGIVDYGDITGAGHSAAKVTDLDLTPFPLGYANLDRSCTYCMRSPSRYYKQGLTQNTFKSFPKPLSVNTIEVRKTIMGLYPTPLDCYESLICEEKKSQAFSRDFAMQYQTGTGECMLLYRQVQVGHCKFNKTSGEVNFFLNENRAYLSELLEEATNV